MSTEKIYIKKLISNTLIFGIGNFTARILIFLMVPLYAHTLTTKEYGIVDLLSITVNLIIPIFSFNMHEAILRFTLEKKYNNDSIMSIALYTVILGFIPIVLVAPFVMKVLGTKIYTAYFLLTYIITAFKNILSYYARGIEKVKLVIIVGVIDTLILLTLNLIFLLGLRLGIDGYYYSLIISGIIVVVIYIKQLNIRFKNIIHKEDADIRKGMFLYAIPMIPNSISWWVSNTSDKYILTYFCGVGITGAYAMAYKIPSLLNTVTNIFMQAWQLSAVEEYKKQKNKSFSQVYRVFFGINLIICTLLIICTQIIGTIMFSKEFYEATRFVPILLGAYFFNGLAAYLGSIYTSSKKTNMLFKSTMIGAIVNTIANIILIPVYGAYGAAVATFISYFLVWWIRLINSSKIVALEFNKYKMYIQILCLVGIILCKYIHFGIVHIIVMWIFLGIIIVNNYFLLNRIYIVIFKDIIQKIREKLTSRL